MKNRRIENLYKIPCLQVIVTKERVNEARARVIRNTQRVINEGTQVKANWTQVNIK